jgi:general secretion pathway protein M
VNRRLVWARALAPLAPLRSRWAAIPSGDRLAISLAAAVVGAALLWWVAISPALRTWRSAPAEIEALERELQTMQQLAAQARQMRALPPVPASQAVSVLRAAVARAGPAARLTMQAERAVIQLQSASGEQILALLAEARGGARARAVEAQLVREPGGGYSGTLILALGSAG